jgi:hypothetical protein
VSGLNSSLSAGTTNKITEHVKEIAEYILLYHIMSYDIAGNINYGFMSGIEAVFHKEQRGLRN